jgi:hypothetical protein
MSVFPRFSDCRVVPHGRNPLITVPQLGPNIEQEKKRRHEDASIADDTQLLITDTIHEHEHGTVKKLH